MSGMLCKECLQFRGTLELWSTEVYFTRILLFKKGRPLATLNFHLPRKGGFGHFRAYPFVSASSGRLSGSFDLLLQDEKQCVNMNQGAYTF